jgi:hypothetical protein
MKSKWSAVLFLAFIYLVEPFITGYLAGLNVQATKYSGPFTGSKVFIRNLSGSQVQSLMWDIDTGGTITVEAGVKTAGGDIFVTPAGVGPFTIVGGTPAIEALFLPVCEKIRVTVSVTGTGNFAIIDS